MKVNFFCENFSVIIFLTSHVYVSVFYLQQPNTLLDRGFGGLRPKKLSFRNVSNCVMRLMQSVKFNAEIPFSNVLLSPVDEKSTSKLVRFWITFFSF